MITIAVAGLCIGLQTDSGYAQRLCAPFVTDAAPDFCVEADRPEVEAEQKLIGCRYETAEFACLYRKIAERLPDYDRFVLHGAAIQMDGKAYIFTAKSGTGKTTHIRLWQQRYGEAVRIVNGDKPILWNEDGVWLVCGTPWCGKEALTSTDCVPVHGLCFLERAAENTIRPAAGAEIAERIIHQVYRPVETGRLIRFLTLLDAFLSATPCWRLGCNMEQQAAEIACAAMTGKAGSDAV